MLLLIWMKLKTNIIKNHCGFYYSIFNFAMCQQDVSTHCNQLRHIESNQHFQKNRMNKLNSFWELQHWPY